MANLNPVLVQVLSQSRVTTDQDQAEVEKALSLLSQEDQKQMAQIIQDYENQSVQIRLNLINKIQQSFEKYRNTIMQSPDIREFRKEELIKESQQAEQAYMDLLTSD
jgi:FixJ family two-component response regulator